MSAGWWAVIGAVAVVVIAGLAFGGLLYRANRVGGKDHDFGAKG